MNNITALFKPAQDHYMKSTAAARDILRDLAALPPYHPDLEDYTFEDGLIEFQCFYEVEPAEPETDIDPPILQQVILCHVYVGNIDVLKALTSSQRGRVIEAIEGVI